MILFGWFGGRGFGLLLGSSGRGNASGGLDVGGGLSLGGRVLWRGWPQALLALGRQFLMNVQYRSMVLVSRSPWLSARSHCLPRLQVPPEWYFTQHPTSLPLNLGQLGGIWPFGKTSDHCSLGLRRAQVRTCGLQARSVFWLGLGFLCLLFGLLSYFSSYPCHWLWGLHIIVGGVILAR